MANAKARWFKNPEEFRTRIVYHFERVYRDNVRFLKYLLKLRKILYSIPDLDGDLEFDSGMDDFAGRNNDEEMEGADPMKEGLFRTCMEAMDDYLDEKDGCNEMRWIDSQAPTQHTPESLT
jgi:hypothetical protein